jgi:hypothetical protein
MPFGDPNCLTLLVTTMPLGWPFYLVSAIRLRAFQKKRQAERNQPELDETSSQPIAPPEVVFEDQPEIACELYVRLRQGGWERYLAEELHDLRAEEKQTSNKLRSSGQALQKLQAELNDIRVRQNRIALSYGEFNHDLDEAAVRAEFAEICKFRGVVAVRVRDKKLSVRVNVRVPYKRKRYDLGDWELLITPESFYDECLRSGAKEGADHASPIYHMDDGFCFGDTRSVVLEHLAKGQVAQAVEMLVNALHSFNSETDREKIPRYFKEVENESGN